MPAAHFFAQNLEEVGLDPRGARNYQARKDSEFAKVYRIIYEIRDTELIITVVKIGHRRHVYKSS